MNKVPGVDISTGSLGNGLSIGLGMALSAKLHRQNYTTYVLLGDGEIQEGMVWEAAMAANHHDLKNLVAIVDCNGVQINGWTNDIMTLEPIADKWKAFGWAVVEVNGHNMKDVLTALHTANTMRKPTVILMRTVKGKVFHLWRTNPSGTAQLQAKRSWSRPSVRSIWEEWYNGTSNKNGLRP